MRAFVSGGLASYPLAFCSSLTYLRHYPFAVGEPGGKSQSNKPVLTANLLKHGGVDLDADASVSESYGTSQAQRTPVPPAEYPVQQVR